MVTEKEAVRRERAAFVKGFITMRDGSVSSSSDLLNRGMGYAREACPMAQAERPRVRKDKDGVSWRAVDGGIEWARNLSYGWSKLTPYSMYISEERLEILADLKANPTELVDAE
jgi:hypothetical protein